MTTQSNTTVKDSVLFVRVSEQDKSELIKLAGAMDVPFSQIVRQAIREKIDRLRQQMVAA